jgi:phosphoribosylformimino-5-aminoimidazole carboxamide ribotide isomerase
MSFEVIPAIDLRGGRVVRLAQGDYARETQFDADPVALAREYEAAGARWLHLVDLDAARAGGYTLQALLLRLKEETSLQLQTGGGLRDEHGVAELLGLGADRVVLGTVAAKEPARVATWLARFGAERVVLALDAREYSGDWRVQFQGWTHAGVPLEGLLRFYSESGARHVLCTDIGRDCMLSGFNIELYRRLAGRFPELRFQASGGARSATDVAQARLAGAGGAILGRALLEGRLALSEALAC